jgi:hypothetical protein
MMAKSFQIYICNYPYSISVNIRFRSWNLWFKAPLLTFFTIYDKTVRLELELTRPIGFFIDENWNDDVPF